MRAEQFVTIRVVWSCAAEEESAEEHSKDRSHDVGFVKNTYYEIPFPAK